MAVSKRLRYEILRRDNHTCRYCGATPPTKMTVDHVTPTTLGGGDEPGNLVTACADCNSGKSATPPAATVVEDVRQDAIRWAAAIRQVADAEQAKMAERDDLYAEFWDRWTSLNSQWAWPDDAWQQSLDQFLGAGLTLRELMDLAVRVSTRSKVTQRARWRYFCGAAWRMIRERQDAARRLIEEQAEADSVGAEYERLADYLDTFECIWTAHWLVDESVQDRSESRYRHDGRVYAWQPEDWELVIGRLCARDVPISDVAAALHRVYGQIDECADITTPIVWNVLMDECGVSA